MSDDPIEGKHSYDGIEESDNPMPAWWLNIWYVTIGFALVYLLYYNWLGIGKDQVTEFRAQLDAEKYQKSSSAQSHDFSPDELKLVFSDPKNTLQGKVLFVSKCSACHANDGGGGIGPNLVDRYWIHGGSPSKIAHTISAGVVEKGMISWASMMSRTEIMQVTSYIVSLKGSKPAQPKEAQGSAEE